MYEEERINIRGGIATLPPGNRLDGVTVMEREFNRIFEMAGLCAFGFFAVIAIAVFVGIQYSTTVAVWIGGLGGVALGWPPLMAMTQKPRQEARKRIFEELRAELEANNGLLDGQ